MKIEYDPVKDASNIRKHGVSLSRAGDMDIRAQILDDRFDEERYRLYGYIDGVAHCLAAVFRDGRIRAISLRRAHRKEYNRYVE